jgi:hypothetical protein
LGYTQILGIDLVDNLSPVVNDITLGKILILWIIYDLDCDQWGIETAFLEGKLEPKEYQYMKCPNRTNITDG